MYTKDQVVRFTLFLAVVNFFVAAFLGFIIRLFPFYPFEGINVRHIIHAHSHVAFLGWVFIALIGLIYHFWFSGCKRVMKRFLIFLGVIQISVFGMLATFPFTGYALWSIIFSTMHMIASFYFIFFFKKKSLPGNTVAKPFIYWALIFMALSGIGPLALGPISVLGEKFGMWYNLAIYFYLHFQYNGWFALAIIGILLNYADPEMLTNHASSIRKALVFFICGILLTYFLSVLSYRPGLLIYISGGAGAVLQLWGFYLLLPLFRAAICNQKNRFLYLILLLVISILFTKLLAQFLSAFPYLVEMTYYSRDVVVAYLHWVLLGFTSLFLVWSIVKVVVGESPSFFVKLSVWLFISGLVLMEILLILKFYQLAGSWIFEWLLASAAILLLSVMMFLMAILNSLKARKEYSI